MGKVGGDQFLFQSSGHGGTDDLAGFAETTPVGEKEVTLAGMNHNSPGSVHLGNVNNLTAVGVHGVDGPVTAVCPVDLFVNPVEGNALGVNLVPARQNVHDGVGRGVVAGHLGNASIAADLGEVQHVTLVIKVNADNIGEVGQGLEGVGSVNLFLSVTADVFTSQLGASAEDQVLVADLTFPSSDKRSECTSACPSAE